MRRCLVCAGVHSPMVLSHSSERRFASFMTCATSLTLKRMASPSQQSHWTLVSVWLASTVLLLTVIELVSTAILSAVASSGPPALEALSDAQLAALYSTGDPARYRRVLREGWGHGFHYEPFVEMKMAPFRGEFVNISPQGFRLNTPEGSLDLVIDEDAVLVLGGSTTLGVGVADAETISAQLEAALRLAGHPKLRVYNLAVSSFYSTQERISLEQLLLRGARPRGVILIDGLNDFYACEVPDRGEFSDLLARVSLLSGVRLWGEAIAKASSTLALSRAIRGAGSPYTQHGGKHCGGDDVALRQVIARLNGNREIVRRLGDAFGFSVLFVQQPVPTFHYDNGRRPVPELTRNLAYHANSGRGYELMVAERANLPASTDDVLWLHDLEIPENMYVDAVHYSPAFHRAIAERIRNRLLESAFLTTAP